MEKLSEKIYTKLNQLIEKGDKEAVLKFIKDIKPKDYYEKINSCSGIDQRCVTFAAKCGHVAIVNGLIDHGFDPEELGHVGTRPVRPIHPASEYGHMAVVKTLVKNHGVKVDAESEISSSWYFAIYNNREDISTYLIEECKANVNIASAVPLLHTAIQKGNVSLCKSLIDHGADVNATAPDEVTTLSSSVANGSVDITRFLLDAGVQMDVQSNVGETSLMNAVNNRNFDLVKLLSSYGADAEIQDIEGNTALHVAVFNDDFKIVKFLVCHLNVSLDITTEEGLTPFGAAVSEECFSLMYLFINAGYMTKEVTNLRVQNFSMIAEWLNHFVDFQKVVFTPRTLQELACFKIRRMLGRRFPKVINELSIPNDMRKDLMLEYIQEVKLNTELPR